MFLEGRRTVSFYDDLVEDKSVGGAVSAYRGFREATGGGGQPSLIHRFNSSCRHRTAPPIRTGAIILPMLCSRHTLRVEMPSIFATSRTEMRSGLVSSFTAVVVDIGQSPRDVEVIGKGHPDRLAAAFRDPAAAEWFPEPGALARGKRAPPLRPSKAVTIDTQSTEAEMPERRQEA